MKSKIEKLNDRISFLKQDNENLRRENCLLREDRRKYQEWVSQKFGWFVELLSKSETPCMKWLVQDTTKLLQRTEKFFWESRK